MSTPKVLFVGDIHIQRNALTAFDDFAARLLEYLRTTPHYAVVLLGDILDNHEHIYTVCMNRAITLFKSIKSLVDKLVVLVGNHDMMSNQCSGNEIQHWMYGLRDMQDIFIIDRPTELIWNNVRILCSPYVPPGEFFQTIQSAGLSIESADWIAAHQEFRGAKYGAASSIIGDIVPAECTALIISGHIHLSQIIGTVVYVGSCRQLATGDNDRKIVLSIPLIPTAANVTIQEFVSSVSVDLDVPRRLLLKWTSIDAAKAAFTTHVNEWITRAQHGFTYKLYVECSSRTESLQFRQWIIYRRLMATPGIQIISSITPAYTPAAATPSTERVSITSFHELCIQHIRSRANNEDQEWLISKLQSIQPY